MVNNMYKCLIVKNSFSHSKSIEYKIKRLIEEGNKLDISFDVYSTNEIDFVFKNCQPIFNNVNIGQYNFCIFLDKDKYLAQAINSKLMMINLASAIEICDDKLLTYLNLMKLNIKTPTVVSAPLCYIDEIDNDEAEKFLKLVEKNLKYPFVCKQSYGSLGKQVYLINNREELNDIYLKLRKIPHFYMDYISYEKGTDYRVITIGNKVVASMRRENKNDFRSNIALGGRGTIYKLDKNVKKLICQIVKYLKLNYAGVDIIKVDDSTYNLIEVNSNAFFEEIEIVTKINVAKLLLEHILKKLKKQVKK